MTIPAFFRRLFGIESFQAGSVRSVPSVPSSGLTLDEAMVAVAEELAAERIRESDGPNQGPGIARFWKATSYPGGYNDQQPWCAAVMCWIVKEAAFRTLGLAPYPFTLPRSARVLDWPAWAKANATHWQRIDPAKTTVQEGDIIGWDFNGPDQSSGTHIALATSDERKDGTFETHEGNTNPAGSRDGGGFYALNKRTRRMAIYIIRFIG